MGFYRVFQLDERDRFARFVDFEAANDDQALALGARLAPNGRAEVWCGGRLVGRVGAAGGAVSQTRSSAAS